MAAIEKRQKEISDGLASAERAKKDLDLAQANAFLFCFSFSFVQNLRAALVRLLNDYLGFRFRFFQLPSKNARKRFLTV
jgi:hypothetical protein